MFNRIAGEFAVLPNGRSSAAEVLEIVKLAQSGEVFVRLNDGRMYTTIGGAGLNTPTCIVRATDTHRAVLKQLHSLVS